MLQLGLSAATSERYPQLAERSVGFGVHNRIMEELYERGRGKFDFVEDKDEVIRRFGERQWASSTGKGDVESAVDDGRRRRARYVVYGEVYDFSSRTTGKRGETRISIELRLVDVETHVYVSASATGSVADASDLIESTEIDFARSTVGQATDVAVKLAVGKLLERFEEKLTQRQR